VTRLAKLVEDLSARPESSVPAACRGWAATKGAYRFWSNTHVHPEAIRRGHAARTVERLPETGVILAVQDTTDFEFTDHSAVEGLGYLTHPQHFGLFLHTTLGIDSSGVPLGVLHQHVWTRDPEDFGKRKQRRNKATADKESQRWLTALEQTQEAIPARPGRTILEVSDREADFFDHFAAPRRADTHLLIRAKSRRRIEQEDRLLLAAVQATPASGQMQVQLPRHGGQSSRKATLTIRFRRVEILPPSTHPRRKELRPLPLYAVLAEEENPPAGEQPIRWLLLTTYPVMSFADAVQIVRWYTFRWLIERYHYTLKSGCRIEELQLEREERLERALATYAIVAWRLLWMTYLARQQPEAPCDTVLSTVEWQVLHARFHPGESLPAKPPRLQESVRLIARLGGFLARKGDGQPGVKALWRGIRRLQDMVAGAQTVLQNSELPPGPPRFG
jgi:hypothetical protein